ncbi:hypothetical protein BT96DRAFT_942540 [Gymnopus androsaceus JB14]|uniref:Uncharacterized protein n=1 Tax=Gymnopus androsaceus JB14 TaxID=1447944 RepID=A0A6A4HDY8_9AGAR|nr:hypothetical protein BT96DRAFT_942540 [Gymnopus androsaceus JB14]
MHPLHLIVGLSLQYVPVLLQQYLYLQPIIETSLLIYMVFEPTVNSKTVRAAVLEMVSKSETTLGKTCITGLTRIDFVSWCLRTCQIENNYVPGITSGPAFLMSWTGMGALYCSGGLKGHINIIEDAQFQMAVATLGKCNASKANFRVTVKFDLDQMSVHCIRKRVPKLDNYSPKTIAISFMIEQIDKDWRCEDTQHRSSDQNSVCWIDLATQQHVGIKLRTKKQWASDIIRGTTNLKEPPNIAGVDLGSFEALKKVGFTVELIPDVAVARGIVEGVYGVSEVLQGGGCEKGESKEVFVPPLNFYCYC